MERTGITMERRRCVWFFFKLIGSLPICNRFTEILLKKRKSPPFHAWLDFVPFQSVHRYKIEWKIDGGKKREEKIDKSSKVLLEIVARFGELVVSKRKIILLFELLYRLRWNREEHNCKVQFYLYYPYSQSMIFFFLFLLKKRNVNET